MNLLITGAWQGAREHLDQIRAIGHEVVFLPQERDAVPVDPAWVEGVIGNGFFLHHPIKNYVNLKYIQVISAGLDRVPVDEVKRRGITLKNARGVYSGPMAEHAVWAVLTLYRQCAYYMNNQAGHIWNKLRQIPELGGKTVCILGCGSVGTACAERFGGMGCRVIGVNRTPRENPVFKKIYSFADMAEALGMADIVVVTLPLNDETRGLMNAARLAQMKECAILVNIARGPLVDTAALLDALDGRLGDTEATKHCGDTEPACSYGGGKLTRHLGGAALDVFDTEPLPADSPLWDRPDLLLTPHNSFLGEGNARRLDELIMGNLAEIEK